MNPGMQQSEGVPVERVQTFTVFNVFSGHRLHRIHGQDLLILRLCVLYDRLCNPVIRPLNSHDNGKREFIHFLSKSGSLCIQNECCTDREPNMI